MDEVEAELRNSLAALNLPPEQVSFCDPETARRVLLRAKQSFVTGGDPIWWWAALKVASESFHYPEGDGFCHVTEYVPASEERCWLLVEGDAGGSEHVLDVAVHMVPQVISECYACEYYLVGREFDWLVVENHHNTIIVVRSPSA